jgi:hypothetical protein
MAGSDAMKQSITNATLSVPRDRRVSLIRACDGCSRMAGGECRCPAQLRQPQRQHADVTIRKATTPFVQPCSTV